MTANGLTATTNVYAAHNNRGGNHTSSSTNNGMPSSSTPSSNNSPSSSTSGSGDSGGGTGSASNPPLSSGNSGTTAPTTTSATTTKKTVGNNPCFTSLSTTSCSTTGSGGGSGNQSQTNHKGRHHSGGDLGSSTTPKINHYDGRLARNQNSTVGTPSGIGTGSNRTYDSSHGPKTAGKGAGEPNETGTCVDSHFGVYGKGCGGEKNCMIIKEHGLFCRHEYRGGESYSKYEGGTKVMHETEIKVIREPNSFQYNGPSSVVLLSPTSNDFMNNNSTTITVEHVTITTNGEQGWIKGTVTNNSNQTLHGLRITGTWYDSGNNTIGMSSGYVDGLTLNPGQNGTFSQFANYDKSTTPSTVELSYDWQ
jgi:hypothetical protein